MRSAVIVGAGPAGLFAACRLAETLALAGVADREIVVLEKMPRPGLKLLASGSGQCNLTHRGPIADFFAHYHGRERFLKPALLSLDNEALLDWFRKRGLDFIADQGGKWFPASGKASSVLGALLAECERHGVRIRTGIRVGSATATENGLKVCAEGLTLTADALLLASGGASYPKLGSSGDSYLLAKALGHNVIEPRPALAPVKALSHGLSDLAGVSFSGIGIALRRDGKVALRARSDLVITHEGFSGPVILDSSRDMRRGDVLEIDFSGKGAEAFQAAFASETAARPKATVTAVLSALGLPRRLAEQIAVSAGIDAGTTCAELRKEARKAAVAKATSWSAKIDQIGDWDRAMLTAGGVDTSEVDAKTCASRLVPGLYFAGEALDVDGDSGGYNLQAAFSTGALAASAMANRLLSP